MNSWAELLPTVLASVITTLVTLFLAWFSRRASSNRAAKKQPLVLRRGVGSSWTLHNVSKMTMLGVTVSTINAAGGWHEAPYQPEQGILRPKDNVYFFDLSEAESISVRWVILRKFRNDDKYSAEARIKEDLDEVALRPSTYPGHPNGGGK